MRHLRPEFKDMQVCAKCGAPAEILGEPWKRSDGSSDWFASPIEFKCSQRDTGARPRTKQIPDGRRTKEITYYVRVYTHMCTRNSFEDADGNHSDVPEHRFCCGALQEGLTRKVSIDHLPDRCFDDEDPSYLEVDVDPDKVAGRWEA